MSLRGEIVKQQTEALKSRSELRLSVLRMVWSAVRNAEIDKKSELNDEEIQQLIARQIKQLKDALKDFNSAGREDLINKTESELKILEEFVPKQMSDEILEGIVHEKIAELGATTAGDVGKVMGAVMSVAKGQADGGRVREMVMRFLGGE
ncbi:MAG: GatB/YqeY domain-containing protein [Candidatus Magasanikbacteria bacterium]